MRPSCDRIKIEDKNNNDIFDQGEFVHLTSHNDQCKPSGDQNIFSDSYGISDVFSLYGKPVTKVRNYFSAVTNSLNNDCVSFDKDDSVLVVWENDR
jgi:hypothetical protein